MHSLSSTFIIFLISTAIFSGQVTAQNTSKESPIVIVDPENHLEAIDKDYKDWTFYDAFREGDSATYLTQYCRDINGYHTCSLKKQYIKVIAVENGKATIHSEFEDGMRSKTYSIDLENFDATKNFVNDYFSSIDVTPSSEAHITGSALTQGSIDGKSYLSYRLLFTLSNSYMNLYGKIIVALDVPYIARVGLIEHPGTSGFPSSMILTYNRKIKKDQ
jgi:hypothetical protein